MMIDDEKRNAMKAILRNQRACTFISDDIVSYKYDDESVVYRTIDEWIECTRHIYPEWSGS